MGTLAAGPLSGTGSVADRLNSERFGVVNHQTFHFHQGVFSSGARRIEIPLGGFEQLLGQAIQLLTQGITVTSYRPDDVDGEMDVRVRFPDSNRSLDELGNLRVLSLCGNRLTEVPASIGSLRSLQGRAGRVRRLAVGGLYQGHNGLANSERSVSTLLSKELAPHINTQDQ